MLKNKQKDDSKRTKRQRKRIISFCRDKHMLCSRMAKAAAAASVVGGGTGTAAMTSRSLPRMLIIDTDVGFDDLVAVQCLLNTRLRNRHPAPLVTFVGGVVSARRGASTLRELFPQAKIAAGKNSRVMPYDPLPEWLVQYRSVALDAFAQEMKITDSSGDKEASTTRKAATCSGTEELHDSEESLDHVLQVLEQSPDENTVDLICLGPLTNLAHWLDHHENNEQDMQRLSSRLDRIYILGGNHPLDATPEESATKRDPEFNFGLDPQAAHRVFHSPVLSEELHIITSTICDRSRLKSALGDRRIEDFIAQKRTSRYKNFFSTLLNYDTIGYSLSCDPVCAFALEHTEVVNWESVAVSVDTSTGLLIAAKNDQGKKHERNPVVRIASNIDLSRYLSWIDESMDSSNYV
jgi:inosine-uridine nucleoside N-ribohydrolase